MRLKNKQIIEEKGKDQVKGFTILKSRYSANATISTANKINWRYLNQEATN